MKSPFAEVFLFLTDLAWKSRVTIPVLVTTAFLIMDIRLQIEINIQTGQVAAADFEDYEADDDDDDEDTEDSDEEEEDDDDEENHSQQYSSEASNEDENGNLFAIVGQSTA